MGNSCSATLPQTQAAAISAPSPVTHVIPVTEGACSSGSVRALPVQPSGSVCSVAISSEAFVLSQHHGSDDKNRRVGWRSFYAQGRELGRGVSAAVFESEARAVETSGKHGCGLPLAAAICGGNASLPCLPSTRRRVAIKRFKKLNSKSFQTEKAALVRVGVHPNVVRLLESYEDSNGEGVLILEYCDGLTVFEAHMEARKRGENLSELLVARLLRQILLALEHIDACGVEHQDVKPENLLLHTVSFAEQQAEVKLADFGWAQMTTPTKAGRPLTDRAFPAEAPADGAGSLWYAPPELNPPVELEPGGLTSRGHRSPGKADMWSMGVVAYVLLVGHNPFGVALGQTDRAAVESQVLRLVAQGRFDTESAQWRALAPDARDFIMALLRVAANTRLTAKDALQHPFLRRCLARCTEAHRWEQELKFRCEDGWSLLDGFQHLSWLAVARAVAEPELSREVIQAAVYSSRRGALGSQAYLWSLARELSIAPPGCWLKCRAAWPEVLRLAFSYLDVDGDGSLCVQDLASHLALGSEDPTDRMNAYVAATTWVRSWARDPGRLLEVENAHWPQHGGLSPEDFRAALLAIPPEEVGLLGSEDGRHDSEDIHDYTTWGDQFGM